MENISKKSAWSKFANFMDKFIDITAMTLCAVLFILLIYQVILRYVLGQGNANTNEIVTYLFIWVIYLGMIVGSKDKEQIAVTMLPDALKPKARSAMLLLSSFIWFFYNTYVIITSIKLIQKMIPLGAKTSALQIYQYYLYMILPICFIWTSIYVVRDAVNHAKVLLGKDKGGDE